MSPTHRCPDIRNEVALVGYVGSAQALELRNRAPTSLRAERCHPTVT